MSEAISGTVRTAGEIPDIASLIQATVCVNASPRKSPSRPAHAWRRTGSRWRNRRSCPSTDSPGRCARRSSRSARNAAPGASSTGGMHISPEICSPYLSRQAAMNASASAGRDARLLRLLAGVELNEQLRRCAAADRSPWLTLRKCSAGPPNEWRRTARPPPSPCWTAAARSDAARCRDGRHQPRPFRLGFLHAIFAEYALSGRNHRLDRIRHRRFSTPRSASPRSARGAPPCRRARCRFHRGQPVW